MSIGAAEAIGKTGGRGGDSGNNGKLISPGCLCPLSKSVSSECCAKCQSEPKGGLLLRLSAPAFRCHEK